MVARVTALANDVHWCRCLELSPVSPETSQEFPDLVLVHVGCRGLFKEKGINVEEGAREKRLRLHPLPPPPNDHKKVGDGTQPPGQIEMAFLFLWAWKDSLRPQVRQ